MLNANRQAEKKSLSLGEVSALWWVPAGARPATDRGGLERKTKYRQDGGLRAGFHPAVAFCFTYSLG